MIQGVRYKHTFIEENSMKRLTFLILFILLLVPVCQVNAEDVVMESGKKVNGTYAGEEEYHYYEIHASSSDYIAVTAKTSDQSDLILDICDSNRQVIASEINIPNKETVLHKADKGAHYYLRIRGTEGVTYTITYKMKSLKTMKYAKKYNYIFTNASLANEKNAVAFKIKSNYSGILQLMFDTDKSLNVKFANQNKKALSAKYVVDEHAFSGMGVQASKTIYAKMWLVEDTIVGTTSVNKLKYQIDSVPVTNGASKAKARSLSKGKYIETLVPAGKKLTSWYKVKLSDTQKLSITVESRMLKNMGKNLQLYICNSDGKSINTNAIVLDGETTVLYNKKYVMKYPETTFGTTAEFPEGTYYIRVESNTKTSTGSYRIKWE